MPDPASDTRDTIPPPTLQDVIRMQEIEGNPLTEAEIEMFEMFEREGWPHQRRREYILAQLTVLLAK